VIAALSRRSARALGIAVAAAVLVAAAALALVRQEQPSPLPARAASERPTLMLVTTLPLVFSDTFSLAGGGSKALSALETRYAVVPIGTSDAQALNKARLLLMAHPLAQPAEALVDLDRWVREGGRVLLLADPRLDWPSERAMGDNLRPPPAFADTGLLAHWGLRLDAPDKAGPVERELGGRKVLAWSPGTLSGGCAIGRDGFVARCRIGQGRATILADADFLNVEQLGGPKDQNLEQNLDALLAELGGLESR
jgi:hypothetical protein